MNPLIYAAACAIVVAVACMGAAFGVYLYDRQLRPHLKAIVRPIAQEQVACALSKAGGAPGYISGELLNGSLYHPLHERREQVNTGREHAVPEDQPARHRASQAARTGIPPSRSWPGGARQRDRGSSARIPRHPGSVG